MSKFYNLLALFAAMILFASCCNPKSNIINLDEPKRPAGVTDVLELRCEPIETVRIAFIGLGMRGEDGVRRYLNIEGVEIVALCDIRPEKVANCQKQLADAGRPAALEFTDTLSWKEICKLAHVDLVYVCTQWDLHTPIAVEALNNGKHVALEVPAALNIAECWQLVDAAEKNRKHCIMLENCCYDFFEMATLNMAQQNKFGEIVHVEGAYIHDLRWLQFDDTTGYWNNWRLRHNTKHTGDPYPTHGLGPVSQILNIHRGDKMEFLVSVSTNQFGITEYTQEKFGKDDPRTKVDYQLGDMNTTIIKTVKGKTMMIQHDITSPRPYNRHHLISGTKGFAQKYPRQSMAFEPDGHRAILGDQLKDTLLKYDHPLNIEIGELARLVGGHGGMDYIMDYRLIYCLRNGLPLDMDVYDAAEWSAIVELSEISTKNSGAPVKVPDFTRGAWNKLDKLTWYKK